MDDFPRTPITLTGGDRIPTSSARSSDTLRARRPYDAPVIITPVLPAEEGSLTFTAKGKTEVKTSEKVVVTEGPITTGDNHKHHHKKGRDGCSWLVWVLVIFIVIILIIMGIMWWAQPDCVTRDRDDGNGREINPYTACAYAFGIALVAIIFLVVAWLCCAQ